MEQIWTNKVITLNNGQQRKLLEVSTGTNKIVRKETVNSQEYWVTKPYDFNFDSSYSGDFVNGIPTPW